MELTWTITSTCVSFFITIMNVLNTTETAVFLHFGVGLSGVGVVVILKCVDKFTIISLISVFIVRFRSTHEIRAVEPH